MARRRRARRRRQLHVVYRGRMNRLARRRTLQWLSSAQGIRWKAAQAEMLLGLLFRDALFSRLLSREPIPPGTPPPPRC